MQHFDPITDIVDFHEKFDLAYDGPPRLLSGEVFIFRSQFLYEEVTEYRGSTQTVDQLDALVDLVYVALGTAYLQGFNFAEAWRRVHAANMQKVRATLASDSKRHFAYDVVKPEGWKQPDLFDLA